MGHIGAPVMRPFSSSGYGIASGWMHACSFGSALLGLAVVSLPLVAYFHLHGVLDNFWFYSFGIFMGKSYGNGFSLAVGAVGLLRTGLIWWLLPALALLHVQYGAA